MALPGTAAANDTAICKGKLTTTKIHGFGPGLQYSFSCEPSNADASGDISGFSISVNRRVNYFSPETVGVDPEGEPSGESFSCQGSFPSWGFGCALGSMVSGNSMTGEFATERKACAEAGGSKLAAWVSVTSTQVNHLTATPYTDHSEPYKLRGPNCRAKRGAHRR